jgi:ATP-dependent DNA helicase RecG
MAIPINIEKLLGGNTVENNRIELKGGWNPDSIYRTICAFANDFEDNGSGYIIVGVDEDNGRPVRPVRGVPIETIDRIEKEMVGFNNLFEPFYMPRVSIEDIDGKKVIVIWVLAGDRRPYKIPEHVTAKHKTPKYFIRYNSSTIEAKGENEIELFELANRVPFDDRGNLTAKISDVSMLLIREFLNQVQSKLLDDIEDAKPHDVLEQMGLLDGPIESERVKNVALMMFSYHPEKFFPGTQIDIVIYPRGKDDDPDNFIEIDPIKGPVNIIIQKALDFLRTMVIQQRVQKVPTQAEAIRTYNYPYQALEEAVTNSMYHRSYQEREPVEISVMPDQIEIISYGGADRSLSLDALRSGNRLHARRYRNRRLGDFLHELGLTEGRGTGLPTIHRELKKNGSPDAYIETDPDRTYFIISIPCHKDFVTDELVVDKSGNVVGKDWVTKLGHNWVSEDDAAKAINAINKQYNTELAASKAASITASKAASTATSIIRLLDALLVNDFSTRQLFLKASIPYNDTSRKKYVNFLVELGLIDWDHSLSKRSPNQTLHLTDLGKAVLQRIKQK